MGEKARGDQGLVGCSAIISGQGDWQFQFMPGLVNLPQAEANNDENGHGLEQDVDGSMYFTFVPKHVTDNTQVLVKYSVDGKQATLLGQPGPKGLSAGVPHGI